MKNTNQTVTVVRIFVVGFESLICAHWNNFGLGCTQIYFVHQSQIQFNKAEN